MFDFGKFVALITGGLTNPQPTWEAYLGEVPGWQKTAIQLTAPLVVAAVLVGWLLALILGGIFMFGGRGLLLGLILALLWAGIAVTVMSFAVSLLAGTFGGRNDFDRAFAGVSLAYIPGWVGMALSGIPFIGWLFSLIGTIVGLVFLYRIIPLAVNVPEDKRVVHFILTIVLVFVINLIVAAILGGGHAMRMAGA